MINVRKPKDLNNRNIFQYLPLTRANGSYHYVRKLAHWGVSSILDLEDTAQDLHSEPDTLALKASARQGLYKIANYDWQAILPPFVRVNAPGSSHFELDLELLFELANIRKFPLRGLFVPKCESIDQLQMVVESLPEPLKKLELVPMIETAKGMDGVATFAQQIKRFDNVSMVHFGHFDYFADTNEWPFPTVKDDRYWRIVSPLLETLAANGLGYLHAPPPEIEDAELMWATCAYIKSNFPNLSLAMTTLNFELSVSKMMYKTELHPSINARLSEADKLHAAKEVVSNYLHGRASRRSFAVANGIFIPPQMYLAAKALCDSMEAKISSVRP